MGRRLVVFILIVGLIPPRFLIPVYEVGPQIAPKKMVLDRISRIALVQVYEFSSLLQIVN